MGRRKKKYLFDPVKDELNLNKAEAHYKAHNTDTMCVNQALNVIGQKLEIPFTLSFHSPRHTFAVVALNDGLSMTVIRLLGHGSTDVTEKVHAKFLPPTLTAEVERLGYACLPEELK